MIECRVSINSSNSVPPALPAMLNPSLKLPARKHPSMAMCDTTDLNNDTNDLKRRHMKFDDVYPVGETSVTAQGTHTYHGSGSVKYPGESIESFHEPTSALHHQLLVRSPRRNTNAPGPTVRRTRAVMDRHCGGQHLCTLPADDHTDRCQSGLQKKGALRPRTVDQDHVKATTDPSSV